VLTILLNWREALVFTHTHCEYSFSPRMSEREGLHKDDRDEFFAVLDQLTMSQIEARIPLWMTNSDGWGNL
jgi:hypothetical protein